MPAGQFVRSHSLSHGVSLQYTSSAPSGAWLPHTGPWPSCMGGYGAYHGSTLCTVQLSSVSKAMKEMHLPAGWFYRCFLISLVPQPPSAFIAWFVCFLISFYFFGCTETAPNPLWEGRSAHFYRANMEGVLLGKGVISLVISKSRHSHSYSSS